MARRARTWIGIDPDRDFLLLLGAQFAAQAADGVTQAALAELLILEPLGQAPVRVLGIFALTLLPYSVIAPFLGVFVDRWQRRSLMVWTNAARVLLVGSLPLWARAAPGDVAIYGAALVLLGLGRLFLTTKGASLPVVLREHHLLRGNAVSGGGGMIATLAGGIVGLGAVQLANTNLAFGVAAVLYLVGALAARAISSPMAHRHRHLERVRDAVARVAWELGDGIREVWLRKQVRISLFAIFLLRTIGIFVAIAAILVIKSEFPAAADRGGRLGASALALGAAGVGAFMGALSTPLVGRRITRPSLVILGFAISTLGLLAFGGVGGLASTLILLFIGGYGAFVAKIAVDATVQECLPDELRGRAFSLYDILYNLASVAAALVMVVLASSSLRALLLIAGIASLVLGALVGLAMHRAGMLNRDSWAEASSRQA